jgi:hypothetical protein
VPGTVSEPGRVTVSAPPCVVGLVAAVVGSVGNVALDAFWQAVNAAKLKAASAIMTVRRPSGWTVERKHLNKRNSPAETGRTAPRQTVPAVPMPIQMVPVPT